MRPLPFRAPVDHPAALAGGDLPFGLQSVCRTLADANATLERFAWLGDHLAIAEWTRITDESETVLRAAGPPHAVVLPRRRLPDERQRVPRYGAPSLLCALPGDHESRWWVRGEMHFIHLYFLPEHFTQRAIRELDREPRELKLADRTYFEDARVAALLLARAGRLGRCRRTAARERDRARGAEPAAARTEHDPHRHVVPRRAAPAVRRRVRDYIDTYLTQPLTLGELADVAALSEYHFSRMFRLSFGRAPHAWVAEQRLARARELLRTTALPLAQIAADCGYANAGHFSHRFRDAHGTTPNTYRRAMQGR